MNRAGIIIREFREMCGYSLRKVCNLTKRLDSGNLSKYENGKLLVPLKLVPILFKIYELNRDDLEELLGAMKSDHANQAEKVWTNRTERILRNIK